MYKVRQMYKTKLQTYPNCHWLDYYFPKLPQDGTTDMKSYITVPTRKIILTSFTRKLFGNLINKLSSSHQYE